MIKVHSTELQKGLDQTRSLDKLVQLGVDRFLLEATLRVLVVMVVVLLVLVHLVVCLRVVPLVLVRLDRLLVPRVHFLIHSLLLYLQLFIQLSQFVVVDQQGRLDQVVAVDFARDVQYLLLHLLQLFKFES